MDVILVGLPGSGKSVVGRRLAQRHHVPFIDLDEQIETRAGRRIPDIFADDGEAAFRSLERAAIRDLGAPDPSSSVARVVATRATAGPSTAGGSRSGSMDGRRCSPSDCDAHPTCDR